MLLEDSGSQAIFKSQCPSIFDYSTRQGHLLKCILIVFKPFCKVGLPKDEKLCILISVNQIFDLKTKILLCSITYIGMHLFSDTKTNKTKTLVSAREVMAKNVSKNLDQKHNLKG